MCSKSIGFNTPKGPVIGNLVICGALMEAGKLAKLKELGVRDSKLLTPKRRAELAALLKKELKSFKLLEITPQVIDANKASGSNLNTLEINGMASIINELKPDEAYIDAIEANILGFKAKLNPKLRVDCKIVAEHEADAKYPIVSAASILAKTTRDAHIEALKAEYGQIGSGYPSDPVTKDFLTNWLKEHDQLPPIVRTSWATVSDAMGEAKQQSLDDYFK